MSYGVEGPEFPAGCAIVFGGSGGLGAMVAGLLAERGCDVVVTYHSHAENAHEVIAGLQGLGRRGLAVVCDVRDRSAVDAVVSTAVSRFGRIHTVISAQGGKYATGPLADASSSGFQEKLETDICGFLNITQAVIPVLRSGGGGSITAIVSPSINRVTANYGLASVPKTAVGSMVRALAVEEGRHDIRANAVAPGVIDAGMAISLASGPAKTILDAAIAATPLSRMGKVQEVAETIVFLASARAGYVTGQLLMVDGGFSL